MIYIIVIVFDSYAYLFILYYISLYYNLLDHTVQTYVCILEPLHSTVNCSDSLSSHLPPAQTQDHIHR